MPTCDLITSARALYNLNNLAVTSDEATTLRALITAVSAAITVYCRRAFCATDHDVLYNGEGQTRLLLKHYPVISVQRVCGQPTQVLTITNTASANQRATVAVTSSGITCTRVASGTSTSDTLTFADNPTLQALAVAISALGNGWGAQAAASHALRASADLRAIQGALNAKDVYASLSLHVEELAQYEIDAERGWLLRGTSFLDDDAPPSWYGGINYWRVLYTAGYATIPEDVQEACAIWTATLFWQTKRDPGLSQESIPGVMSRLAQQGMPLTVQQLLAPYRNRALLHLGG